MNVELQNTWNVGNQPKDLSVALNAPETILVATDSGAVPLNGLKILSSINLLGTEIESRGLDFPQQPHPKKQR